MWDELAGRVDPTPNSDFTSVRLVSWSRPPTACRIWEHAYLDKNKDKPKLAATLLKIQMDVDLGKEKAEEVGASASRILSNLYIKCWIRTPRLRPQQ